MYPESEQATRLVILGTGNAMATRCYNTCFALCPPGGDILLVDAGGGNGIFRQMEAAALPYERVRHLYLTHGHTDHALGMIWVLRKITALMCAGRYEGDLHVHCHSDAAALLRTVCTLMLPGKYTALFDQRVRFHIVADGEQADLLGMAITFFDIHSTKLRQFGFAARLPSGLRLACLGDEPFNPLCGRYVEGCGLLMSEAFCLYADRERFRPYENTTAPRSTPVASPRRSAQNRCCSTIPRMKRSPRGAHAMSPRPPRSSLGASLCRTIWTPICFSAGAL